MTTTSPVTTNTDEIDRLIHLARERSTHGRATRADWERVYALDPARAERSLREHLQRSGPVVDATVNPYEKRGLVNGASAGFVIGVVLMAAIWLLLAWIRNEWVTTGQQWNAATMIQFGVAVLPPLGAFIGARLDRRSKPEPVRQRVSLRDASFAELLDRFEQTQRVGHARVY